MAALERLRASRTVPNVRDSSLDSHCESKISEGCQLSSLAPSLRDVYCWVATGLRPIQRSVRLKGTCWASSELTVDLSFL